MTGAGRGAAWTDERGTSEEGRRRPEAHRPGGSGGVTPRASTVVVGAGLTGLCTAWALARRGRDVLVIEQADVGHAGGGSHGSCRIFRYGYEQPEYVRLAGQARTLWRELENASGTRLLHPCPQLTFGPLMPEVLAAMREAGAPCEVLPAAEAARRFPGVTASGDVLYEPESAVIAADQSLAALADLVARGGEVRSGATVTGLADDGRQVLVSTTAGDVLADVAIVCAGPWTPGLLGPAAITVPGGATLEQVAYLAPAAADGDSTVFPDQHGMPIFVHYGGEFPYGLPVPGSDRYKLGLHHGGPPTDPDRQEPGPDQDLTARTERAARQFLPGCDPVPVATERCVYDNSPDTDFVVDRIGNIVIGSGTSGHGFKFGPLLGEWLAILAVGANAAAVPRRFALSRF